MAKFEVTPALANIIKTTRVQYGISAKSIASKIGKSQSYMSRLEKAEIKTIDEQELTAIFTFIFPRDEDGKASLDSILEKIYDTVELQYSDEEIKEQLWLDTYDTVFRKIPIPDELIDDIVSRMNKISLSVDTLANRINANEGILPKVQNADRYPFNEWQAFVTNHHVEFYFIKVSIPKEDISKILSKEKTNANYIALLAIAYYLHKIELFGEQVLITDDENEHINYLARDYLNKYRFFSLSEKRRLTRQAKNVEELDDLLSSFDRENQTLINRIVAALQMFSEFDIQNGNKKLYQLVANLDWDIGFMITLSSMKFVEMKDVSFSNKEAFLHEVHNLITKYKSLPQKQVNLYEVMD